MSDTNLLEKPEVILPMAAKFLHRLDEGLAPGQYRERAEETGPGATSTPPDQFGNPDSMYDIKDVKY